MLSFFEVPKKYTHRLFSDVKKNWTKKKAYTKLDVTIVTLKGK